MPAIARVTDARNDRAKHKKRNTASPRPTKGGVITISYNLEVAPLSLHLNAIPIDRAADALYQITPLGNDRRGENNVLDLAHGRLIGFGRQRVAHQAALAENSAQIRWAGAPLPTFVTILTTRYTAVPNSIACWVKRFKRPLRFAFSSLSIRSRNYARLAPTSFSILPPPRRNLTGPDREVNPCGLRIFPPVQEMWNTDAIEYSEIHLPLWPKHFAIDAPSIAVVFRPVREMADAIAKAIARGVAKTQSFFRTSPPITADSHCYHDVPLALSLLFRRKWEGAANEGKSYRSRCGISAKYDSSFPLNCATTGPLWGKCRSV